uniref:Uncharacterized protein n=1 Tax=Ciona intestinalis TaxID=7719 RepID=H2XX39_CIOIN
MTYSVQGCNHRWRRSACVTPSPPTPYTT